MKKEENKTPIQKDANKTLQKEDRKKLFKDCKEGKASHKQYNSLAKNLIPLNERSKEERIEIARKGAMATNALKGERKNAKQILDTLLPLYANNDALNDNDNIPNDIKQLIIDKNIKITQYDLIMLSMIHRAQNGDVKASEYISNHFGDVVVKETHNINETMNDNDRQLIEKLSSRLGIIESE